MTRTTRRTAAALALTIAGPGVTAASASAGTLSASGSAVTFKAKGRRDEPGDDHPDGNSITVKDGGGKVTAGAGCTGTTVQCDLSNLTAVVVDLGNKNDTLDPSGVRVAMTVDAGSGDDNLTTGSAADPSSSVSNAASCSVSTFPASSRAARSAASTSPRAQSWSTIIVLGNNIFDVRPDSDTASGTDPQRWPCRNHARPRIPIGADPA
jgi:hypothetical protein